MSMNACQTSQKKSQFSSLVRVTHSFPVVLHLHCMSTLCSQASILFASTADPVMPNPMLDVGYRLFLTLCLCLAAAPEQSGTSTQYAYYYFSYQWTYYSSYYYSYYDSGRKLLQRKNTFSLSSGNRCLRAIPATCDCCICEYLTADFSSTGGKWPIAVCA